MNAIRTATPRRSIQLAAIKKPRTTAVMKRSTEAVLFEYNDNKAGKVCIAGSFNDWRPGGLEMINMGNGRWAKELQLPPGTYEYRLVVDGKWKPDPRSAHSVPNPFGEMNSLLIAGMGVATSARQATDGMKT